MDLDCPQVGPVLPGVCTVSAANVPRAFHLQHSENIARFTITIKHILYNKTTARLLVFH